MWILKDAWYVQMCVLIIVICVVLLRYILQITHATEKYFLILFKIIYMHSLIVVLVADWPMESNK